MAKSELLKIKPGSYYYLNAETGKAKHKVITI